MATRLTKFPPSLLARPSKMDFPGEVSEFKDTDPQMLFAMWEMEMGIDPDTSLELVKDAEVVYDKFAPRLSNRFR